LIKVYNETIQIKAKRTNFYSPSNGSKISTVKEQPTHPNFKGKIEPVPLNIFNDEKSQGSSNGVRLSSGSSAHIRAQKNEDLGFGIMDEEDENDIILNSISMRSTYDPVMTMKKKLLK